MGLLDYSRSNPWVSDALATISQGLLSYGTGNQNALAQLPQFLAERQRYRKDDQRQAKMDQRQEQIWQMQEEERLRTQNQEAAKQQAFQGLLPTLPENIRGTAQAMGPSFVDIWGKEQVQNQFQDPENIKDRYINVGGSLIDLKGDPTKPVYVDPKEPKAPRDSWEPYKDPISGMTGQRNAATGKVDWDPGQTGGIQVDTNGDGQPDIVVGGKGMKPPTESQAKAANQATMLDEALTNNEALLSKGGINALRMAGADTISQYGPLGQLGAQAVMSPEEKQFQASRAAALESLANMITGAAFTEEQKRNFQAMLPAATDDAETSAAKLKSLRRSLAQLKKNAGPALDQPASGAVVETLDGNGWDDE